MSKEQSQKKATTAKQRVNTDHNQPKDQEAKKAIERAERLINQVTKDNVGSKGKDNNESKLE